MNYEQIWLTGFMATGKSRTARPLATALDWTPVDLDDLIEERGRRRASPTSSRKGGQAAFRAIEAQVIEQIAGMHNVVVATGGGSILPRRTGRRCGGAGFIVCLDARPETIAARIADSTRHVSERPLLVGRRTRWRRSRN